MTPQTNEPSRWYPRLAGVVPGPADEAIRIAFDNLYALRTNISAVQSSIPAPGPTLAQIQAALTQTGTHPLNVTGLQGAASSAAATTIVNIHSVRINTQAGTHAGWFFVETDRNNALYVSNGSVWVLVWGIVTLLQSQVAAFAATLTANDAGFLIFVSDYVHTLLWSGTALGWAPQDDHRAGEGPVMREVDPSPTTGWHLYDGNNNVYYLQNNGNVAGPITLPNLCGNNGTSAYAKLGTPNSNINAPTAPTATVSGNATVGNNTTGITLPADTGNNATGITLPFDTGGNTTGVTIGPNNAQTGGTAAGITFYASSPHNHNVADGGHSHSMGNVTDLGHIHTMGSVTDPGHVHSLNANNLTIAVSNNGQPENIVRRVWFRM